MSQRFKVGEAPWEVAQANQPQTFAVGQAPWEQQAAAPPPAAAAVDPDRFSGLESLIEGQGQSLTFGYLPKLQAATMSLWDKDLTYEQALDLMRKRNRAIAEEDPLAYGAGQIAGAVVGSAAVPGSFAARGLTAAGKLSRAATLGAAQGAVYNPGETEGGLMGNLEARGQQALAGAALAGAGQGVGSALKAGGKALKQGREALALKLAGGRKAHFREQGLGKKRSDLVNFMEKEGMTGPGQTFETVNEKAAQIRANTGQKIGDIYSDVQKDLALASTAKPQIAADIAKTHVDARDIAARAIRAARNEYKGKSGGEAVINAVRREAKNLKRISNKADTKQTPFKRLLEYRQSLDDNINWHRNTMVGKAADPANEAALKVIRRVTKNEMDNRVKSLDKIIKKHNIPGAKDRVSQLKPLNERYQKASTLKRMSDDRVFAEEAKANIGLLETIGGAGYAGAQIAQGEDPVKAIGKGLVGAMALRQARKYGPGIGYQTVKAAEKASGGLGRAAQIPPYTYIAPWLGMTGER